MSDKTIFDSRQIEHYDNLDNLTTVSKDTLRSLLESINSEFVPPLRIIESSPAGLTIDIEGISVANTNTNRNRTVVPIGDVIPSFTGTTVTFPASSGGNITGANVDTTALTITDTYYINVGFSLKSDGDIRVILGTEGATAAAATKPAAYVEEHNIGYVTIHNDNGDIQNITAADIYQYIYNGAEKLQTRLNDPRKIFVGASNADFTNFDDAYDEAENGDMIVILSGTYNITTPWEIDGKHIMLEMGPDVILDGTSCTGAKGISISESDTLIYMNGATMQNFSATDDYAIYVEDGAARCKIIDGRFTGNDGDIYGQEDTIIADCVGY